MVPDPELRAQVDAALGATAEYRFCGWPHGVSEVWEVAAGGERYFLKRHAQEYKHRRERRFYEEWAPRLPPMTPKLVAVVPGALLITALPGERMETLTLDPAVEREIFVQAGGFLRALHALPYEEAQTITLADELADRMTRWLQMGRDYIADDDRAWAADRFRPHEAFAGEERVTGYADFQPRNWMVDLSTGTPKLGVFDFEHTRGDWWMLGIVKLWDAAWIGRPDLEQSFWRGYGCTLERHEEEQFLQTCVLHAIGVIVWSREHGDERYEAHGRRLLAMLRENGCGYG